MNLPLSFFIVIPAWEDSSSYKILKESPFNVLTESKVLLFKHQEHYYQNGFNIGGHELEVRLANGNTSVFILQNEKGKIAYPITKEFIEGFINKFKSID